MLQRTNKAAMFLMDVKAKIDSDGYSFLSAYYYATPRGQMSYEEFARALGISSPEVDQYGCGNFSRPSWENALVNFDQRYTDSYMMKKLNEAIERALL